MADLKTRFIMNFITDDRWKYLADGLVVTFCGADRNCIWILNCNDQSYL